MSMRHYAFDDYGLVLDKETVKIIASQVFDDYTEDETDTVFDLCDKGICECIGEFTGEAHELSDDGMFSWYDDSRSYDYELIAYIPLKNYPTLFKQAYKNMDEIVEEMKSKIGEYLPEDFDYRSRICHISGTYYA